MRVSVLPQGLAEVARLGDLDLDMRGLGLLGLGQVHAEHAVFKLGADLCGAGIIRKGEVALRLSNQLQYPAITESVPILS